eukprot:TRINITY_DN94042_c0_g1_i1.p1 TRINITY_DN94042_c0_g1~~TRINITY_DN94042_c0_g1_i1.p1  ORF type:complete len:509 (-),score=84.76 TRINITY_DN94042_c0_g1_i1:408-1886(-)
MSMAPDAFQRLVRHAASQVSDKALSHASGLAMHRRSRNLKIWQRCRDEKMQHASLRAVVGVASQRHPCTLQNRDYGAEVGSRQQPAASSEIPRQSSGGVRAGVALGVASVLFASWASRRVYDHLSVVDMKAAVHPDASKIAITSAQRQVRLSFTDSNGRASYALVTRGDLEKTLQSSQRAEEVAALEKRICEAASKHISQELNSCFAVLRARVDKFSDWYFAYPTSYKLLQKAATSCLRHSADISRSVPLSQAVSADIDAYIMQKYERIVLQPEIHDPLLQDAFLNSVRESNRLFIEGVKDLDNRLLAELASKTSHLEVPTAANVQMNLDWSSQLHKIKVVPASFEKVPELTLALSLGGAMIGKAMGAKAAGAVCGKAAATKVAGTMATKFGSPFVAKALAAGSGAAAGAVTGPAGAVLGAGLGLSADYLINRGLELMKRAEFKAEVERVLDSTQQTYFRSLEDELHRAIQVWCDDALQLMPESEARSDSER